MKYLESPIILTSVAILAITAATLKSIRQPEHPRYRWDQADSAFFKEADRHVQNLTVAPDQATPWGQMGMFLMAHQNWKEAAPFLVQAIKRQPANPVWHYLSGINHRINGNVEDALIAYRMASDLSPESEPWFKMSYAEFCFEQAKEEEVLAITQELFAKYPQNPRLNSLIGLSCKDRGDYAMAKTHLELSLQHAPRQKAVAANLAEVYARLGQVEDSKRMASKASRMQAVPWHDPIMAVVNQQAVSKQILLDRMSMALRNANSQYVVQLMNQLLRYHPNASETQERHAYLLVENRQYKDAIPKLLLFLESHPQSVPAHYCLGRSLFETRQIRDSERIVKAGLGLDPTDPPLRLLDAEITCVIDGKASAKKLIQELLSDHPAFSDAYHTLALILMSEGAYEEARAVVRNGFERAGNSPRLQRLNQEIEELSSQGSPQQSPPQTLK